MKKYLILILLFILLTTGCSAQKPTVGVLVYDQSDTFMQKLTSQLAKDGNMFDFDIRYAATSQSIQNEQLVSLINENAKLILVNAVDRLAAGTITKKCAEANIPLIYFNREPVLNDLLENQNLYYIGADASDMGLKQAAVVERLFEDPMNLNSYYDKNNDNVIQICIIKGEPNHQDAERRTTMCIEGLKRAGFKVEILEVAGANWQKHEGYKVMQSMYEKYGDKIEVVFSNNDDMAAGACDYLLEKEVLIEGSEKQSIQILGVDGTSVGYEYVERGLMVATILNDDVKQSQAITMFSQYLLGMIKKEEIPFEITNGHFIYIPGKIVEKSK